MMQAPVLNLPERASQEASRLFVPEELTPLAFTAEYHALTDSQRRRYNQLHGLYFLEQTIFFEQCLGRPALERLLAMAPSAHLREVINEFISEENRHTGWFHTLLKECEPTWYQHTYFHILAARPLARSLLAFTAQRPCLFPFLLWLQIITEERAQHFSAVFVKQPDKLDSRFFEVQRKHLADEGGHIRWDAELIEWLWPNTSAMLRRINARLLGWSLREFFYLPKRSGWRVVEHLISEFPELEANRANLHAATQNLAGSETYLRTLYPRTIFPRTRRLARHWPELSFLEQFFTD